MPYHTESERWRALTIRDPKANGVFVYAVKSTNCYCRPNCPARLARRANVVFYNNAAEAGRAGFRACKRCKPQEKECDDPQEKAVAKACALIDEAVKGSDPKALKLQDLARDVGLTPRYLHKIFKDKTGLTPKEYGKVKMVKDSAEALPTPGPSEGVEFLDLDGLAFNDLLQPNSGQDFGLEHFTTPQGLSPDELLELSSVLFGEQIGTTRTIFGNESFEPAPLLTSNLAAEGVGYQTLPTPEWDHSGLETPLTRAMETSGTWAISGGKGVKIPDWIGSGGGMTASQGVYQDFV